MALITTIPAVCAVLARLDPFAFQQQLNQQQAQLLNQQAQLNRIINGNTVGQAQRSYDQAQKIVDSTQDNASPRSSSCVLSTPGRPVSPRGT